MQRPSLSKPESKIVILTEDGGLKKEILKEGTGSIIPNGVKAIVHYTGRLTTGQVFDSSKKRNKPFTFNLGAREVILGWDKGVATMRKGETCILTCAPDYGYGSRGASGVIPPNATLLFEVELLDWKDKSDEIDFISVLNYVILGNYHYHHIFIIITTYYHYYQ